MELIDAADAARRLGVKRETLYAYVSRGTLASHRAADGRRSLFEVAAVERLARKGRPRRATQRGAVDLTVETSITALDDHSLRYRGVPVGALATTQTYERVAAALWEVPDAPWRELTGWRSRVLVSTTLVGVLREVCAILVADPVAGDDPAASARTRPPARDEVAAAGRAMVATAIAAMPLLGEERTARLALDGMVLRGTVAGRLWPRLTPRRPTPAAVRVLNAAMVAMADHELAASTLAVRVAASTWASPAGVVLAGLGALSGPLHGSASAGAHQLIGEALAVGPARAVGQLRSAGGRVPGFGHKVYAGPDPRAALLLDLLEEVGPARTVRVARQLVDVVEAETGRAPNVDLALAVMAHCCAMDRHAGEVVMSLARIAGWLAHALEEYDQPPLRFRVRAAFVGP